MQEAAAPGARTSADTVAAAVIERAVHGSWPCATQKLVHARAPAPADSTSYLCASARLSCGRRGSVPHTHSTSCYNPHALASAHTPERSCPAPPQQRACQAAAWARPWPALPCPAARAAAWGPAACGSKRGTSSPAALHAVSTEPWKYLGRQASLPRQKHNGTQSTRRATLVSLALCGAEAAEQHLQI